MKVRLLLGSDYMGRIDLFNCVRIMLVFGWQRACRRFLDNKKATEFSGFLVSTHPKDNWPKLKQFRFLIDFFVFSHR